MSPFLTLSLLLPAAAGQTKPAPPAPAGVTIEAVSYRAGKDTVKAVRCRPAGKGPFPAVLLIHGDFGPTKWVEQQARRLAEKGYVALAVDLYRGELPRDIE